MAKRKAPKRVEADNAEILNDDPRDTRVVPEDERQKTSDEKLVAWVTGRTDEWKEHRNGNYAAAWDTYERLWRGIYSESEKGRKSERSRVISPALSEAVENGASEIEEAVFGRGDFFDITPEQQDTQIDTAILSRNEVVFKQDLAATHFTENCAEAILNSAIYGTGIAEIIIVKETIREITMEAPEDGEEGATPVTKTIEREIERPSLRSVNPRNFIIDPSARGIDDALGFAIEEDVGIHLIREGIEKGDYNKIKDLGTTADTQIKPDPQIETPWTRDTGTVLRYYGKVPKHLLFPKDKTEQLFDEEEPDESPANAEDMVEAVVVIINKSELLKSEETRDMMKDRPAVAYQWDIVPGRFWGRGICEKGCTPQKLLDAELRSRMDALAFTAAPMIAVDASRLPRGFKLEVYPGKSILLAGNPKDILQPFKFGEVDQNTVPQIQMLDQMVQRATGSVDSVGQAQAGVSGQARSGAVSMAMSGIVKRNKRTLMRYVNRFLAPAMRKLLWRYMQYNQPRYTPVNFSFNVSSTMGIMQREYETANLAQLLNAMQPGTSEHLLILMGIVANGGIQGRDRVLGSLQKKLSIIEQAESQPPVDPNAVQQSMDPVMLQMQRVAAQLELAEKQAKIAKLQAETRKLNAETINEQLEPQFEQQKIALRGIYKTPEEQIDEEFDRRMRVAQLKLDAADMQSNERIAVIQGQAAVQSRPLPNPPAPPPAPQAPKNVEINVTENKPVEAVPAAVVMPFGPGAGL